MAPVAAITSLLPPSAPISLPPSAPIRLGWACDDLAVIAQSGGQPVCLLVAGAQWAKGSLDRNHTDTQKEREREESSTLSHLFDHVAPVSATPRSNLY